MAFPTRMWVNGVDVNAAFGVGLDPPDGFLGGPARQDQLVSIPETMGSLRIGRAGEVPPRRFTMRGVLRANSTAAMLSLWHGFLQFLNQESLEVRFSDWPEMVGTARLENGPPWERRLGIRRGGNFTLAFLMPNPLKYALQPDVYVLLDGAQQVPILLGSSSSFIEAVLVGTGQPDPALYYRDAQGWVRGQVLYDFPAPSGFPTGTWIAMDALGISYWRLLNQTVQNAGPFLKDTSRLIRPDPNDGDATTGPTLQAVNCNAHVYIRRAWL